ncbi:cyclase family protein [soil metagenome]
MNISIETNNQNYKINIENPLDISIPLKFNNAQPNAYGAEKAISKPCKAGEIVGDTRRGGSCNFEQITFIPHCSGTHTECVGHITNERIAVHDCLKDAFIPATFISIEPEKADQTNETYSIDFNANDKIITRKTLENALQSLEKPKAKNQKPKTNALIIRTLPNDESKLTREYLEIIPPFFSTEAMKFIREIGIKHLLVDIPSIDRIFDEGKLSNHRIFWNVEQGKFELNEKSLRNNTITEMIFVPNSIADGFYLLNLQIAAFESDASPARPILFKLSRNDKQQ